MWKAALVSGTLSVLVLAAYRKLAERMDFTDKPNLRSAHKTPVALGGGLVFVGIYLAWVLVTMVRAPAAGPASSWAIAIGGSLVAGAGLWDDLCDASAKARLAIHLLAGVILTGFYWNQLMSFPGGVMLVAICPILVAWSINLFNFMDGTDAFAATEALSILLPAGLLLAIEGHRGLATHCMVLAGGTGGFLYWNRPRARIFMGDVGSGFLGFMVAALAVITTLTTDFPAVIWPILYGYFLYDTGVTLMRRAIRGEPVWLAHNEHGYQRLVHRAGWSHTRVWLDLVCVNAGLLIIAVAVYFGLLHQAFGLGLALALVAWHYTWLDRLTNVRDAKPELTGDPKSSKA